MASYAIAQLREVKMGEEVVRYLEAIDSTLEPFRGRFLIHGGPMKRVEGNWPSGDLIVIEFPSRHDLEAWYASEEYQKILPLRSANSVSEVIFVDGVPPDHSARDVLKN
jgi:uncharacterized protein (DUF1330 family)